MLCLFFLILLFFGVVEFTHPFDFLMKMVSLLADHRLKPNLVVRDYRHFHLFFVLLFVFGNFRLYFPV
jgi:hypothetical protein